MSAGQRVVAVLLSAGDGRRFGATAPKQYVSVGGRPIFIHTLEKFISSALFPEIVLVVHEERLAGVRALVEEHLGKNASALTTVIPGGPTRSHSTSNAVKYLRRGVADFVLFHDVVRPFVDVEHLRSVVNIAEKHGAAVTAIKAIESVATTDGGNVVGVFPSKNLFFMQTPECYAFSVIDDAYKKFSEDADFFPTATNLHLCHRLGVQIPAVVYEGRNLKLTFPSDLPYAESVLKQVHDSNE